MMRGLVFLGIMMKMSLPDCRKEMELPRKIYRDWNSTQEDGHSTPRQAGGRISTSRQKDANGAPRKMRETRSKQEDRKNDSRKDEENTFPGRKLET